jgi:probable phosphoglycerate mutase
MDWGIYTGKRLDDVDWTNLPPSVESLDALFQRAIDFIAYLKKNFSGQQIVVIGHGAFNRAIIAYLNGKKAIDMIDLPIMENTSCIRFTLVDDNQTV